MPITYQRLGNSGGGSVNLKITTFPNTEIVLQNDKFKRTLLSDNNGVALFKHIKAGTYTATAKDQTKKIVVLDEQNEFMGTRIKDLPLRSKIKFSTGKKFILMTKTPKQDNSQPHASNIAVFVSEYIVDTYVLEELRIFQENVDWQEAVLKHYKALPWTEKETILPRFVASGHGWDPVTQTYFYLLSQGEMGTSATPDYNEYNFGFKSSNERARKTENGKAMGYWLRDQYPDSGSRISIESINKRGDDFDTTIGGWVEYDELPLTGGIVLACDISQDAYVALDSDGYYRILGM